MRTKLFTLGLAALLPALASFAWAPPARACVNDIDCPVATCGGEVCQWSAGDTVMTCVAAGAAAQGSDGWCTTNADCKCMGEGATCAAPHCTFTLPKDGGATGTTTDASTTTTATDASAETPDAPTGTPASDAATTEPEEASTTTTTDAATGSTSSTPAKSGGCSIGATSAPGASMWGLAIAGVALVARKRRRS